MTCPTRRELEYRRLSSRVQRVILGFEPPPERGDDEGYESSSERGAYSARVLELTSCGSEAHALNEMGKSLYRLHYARGDHEPESYAAVIAAADRLREACPEFVNPPLNAIWAEAGRRDVSVTTRPVAA